MSEWIDRFPTEKGLFWFYGYRWGKISVGRKQEPELCLVRVSKNGTGNCMYVADGGFMYESETECAMFKKVDIPEFPKLK